MFSADSDTLMGNLDETPTTLQLPEILALIGDAEPESSDERRSRIRAPIACRMDVTPFNVGNKPLTDQTAMVFGKDLSPRGISFTHESKLPHGRAIVTFSGPDIGQFCVEVEITWTRPTPIGLFESGCRFIRKLPGHNLSPTRTG